MAKNVTMKKGETIIKCSEDHIEHFQNNGFTLFDEKAVVKKTEKAIKPENVAEYYELSKNGQLKFVVGHKDEQWEELEVTVKKFRDAGVDYPVWIMTVGAIEVEQSATAGEVARKAFRRGYNVAARVHVYLFGNAIGT